MHVRQDRVMAPLGILGGNTASTYVGNMIDLESNLLGRSPTLTIPHVLPKSELKSMEPSSSAVVRAWRPVFAFK